MIPGVHLEVILAAGYAAFLVGAAALLEMLARHSHRRTGQYQNAGFTYRERFDLWECPMGQQLARVEADHARRIVRYRAPAKVCNACSLKNNCTDSSEGRLLERRLDSWIESELRRFHRGVSLTLLLLAMIILLAETLRHGQPRELLLAGALFVPICVVETRLFASFAAREREGDRLERGGA